MDPSTLASCVDTISLADKCIPAAASADDISDLDANNAMDTSQSEITPTETAEANTFDGTDNSSIDQVKSQSPSSEMIHENTDIATGKKPLKLVNINRRQRRALVFSDDEQSDSDELLNQNKKDEISSDKDDISSEKDDEAMGDVRIDSLVARPSDEMGGSRKILRKRDIVDSEDEDNSQTNFTADPIISETSSSSSNQRQSMRERLKMMVKTREIKSDKNNLKDNLKLHKPIESHTELENKDEEAIAAEMKMSLFAEDKFEKPKVDPKMAEILKNICGDDLKSKTVEMDMEEELRQLSKKYEKEDRLFSDDDDDESGENETNIKAKSNTAELFNTTDESESKTKLEKLPDEEEDGDYLSNEDEDDGEYPKSSQRKQRRSSKKAILEMKKEAERLQRMNHVELTTRSSNLSINGFLAQYGMKRPDPIKRVWGDIESLSKESDHDDNDDGDSAEEKPSENEKLIASAAEHEINSKQCKPVSDIATASIALNIKPDRIVPQSRLVNIEQENKALIQKIVEKGLHKRSGKGRALSDHEIAEALNDGLDEDDDIEIIEVGEVQSAPQKSKPTLPNHNFPATLQEKNQMLRRLAEMQNRARREEEARLIAEKLEAKKRKREARRAMRKGDDADDDNIERDDDYMNDVEHDSNIMNMESQIDDEAQQTGSTQTCPRRILDDNEQDSIPTDAASRRVRRLDDEDDADEKQSLHSNDNFNVSQSVELDDEGFALNTLMPIDILGTQDSINNTQSQSELSAFHMMSTSSLPILESKKTTISKPKPAAKPGTLLHFFQNPPTKEKPLVSPTIRDDDHDDGLLDMLSGRFVEDPIVPKKSIVNRMKGRDGSTSKTFARSRFDNDNEDQDDASDSDNGDDDINSELNDDNILGLLSGQFQSPDDETMSSDIDYNEKEGVKSLDADDDKNPIKSEVDEESQNEAASDEDLERAGNNADLVHSLKQSVDQLTQELFGDVSDDNNEDDMKESIARLTVKKSVPPKIKSKFIETEADEEEDEFMGMGGEDGEDSDDESLACSGDEDVIEDFEDVLELHRKQVLDDDSKMVENLLNDVTSGNLRKRAARNEAARGFALSDSEDEEELLRTLKRAKASIRFDDDEDADRPILDRYAANPKTAAFAKCFLSIMDDGDDVDFELSEEEESSTSTSLKKVLARKTSHLSLQRRAGSNSSISISASSSSTTFVKSASNVKSSSLFRGASNSSVKVTECDSDDDVPRPKRRTIQDLPEPGKDLAESKLQVEREESVSSIPKTEIESDEDLENMFGSVDVLSLIKKRTHVPQQRKKDGTEVESIKYTSRAAGTFRLRRSTAGSNDSDMAKLKSKVLASHGGMSGRGLAGGLNYKSSISAVSSTSSRNQGFLVGEAAKAASSMTGESKLKESTTYNMESKSKAGHGKGKSKQNGASETLLGVLNRK